MVFYSSMWLFDVHLPSAVYFEQGDYDKTIETCEMAVEEGRSVRCYSRRDISD